MFEDKIKAALVEAGITVHTVPIVPTNNCTRYGHQVNGYKDASDEDKAMYDDKVITSFVEHFIKEQLIHAYVEPVNLDVDYLYVAVWGSNEPMIEQTPETIDRYLCETFKNAGKGEVSKISNHFPILSPNDLKWCYKFLTELFEHEKSHL
jgi:hypothetical protein